MNRCLLVGAVVLAFPLSARADGPCEAEAAATRGKRDPSLAPPTEPEAIARMKAGNARSLEGTKRAAVVAARDQAPAEFKAAVEEYVAAAMISPAPSILFNLAQTYRAAGDYPSAIEQYRLFLARAKAGRPLRKLVECHIGAMTAELNRAASMAPPRGPAPTDDGPPVDPATQPPSPTPAPAPAVALDLRGEAQSLAAPPWHADTLGWGIAGAGAVAAGVGGYLLIDARSLSDDADAEPRDDVRTELDAKADSRRTWGTITTAAGVAILAIGIVKLAVAPDAPRDVRPRVSLQITAGGVALGGWF